MDSLDYEIIKNQLLTKGFYYYFTMDNDKADKLLFMLQEDGINVEDDQVNLKFVLKDDVL